MRNDKHGRDRVSQFVIHSKEGGTPSVIKPRDHLTTSRGQMAMLMRPRDQSSRKQILTLQGLISDRVEPVPTFVYGWRTR